MVKDERKRIIVNFKNDELELKLYEYVESKKLQGKSGYIKELILRDMREKGLIK